MTNIRLIGELEVGSTFVVHLIDKHFEQSCKTARVSTLMSLCFSLASFITVRKCGCVTQVL